LSAANEDAMVYLEDGKIFSLDGSLLGVLATIVQGDDPDDLSRVEVPGFGEFLAREHLHYVGDPPSGVMWCGNLLAL